MRHIDFNSNTFTIWMVRPAELQVTECFEEIAIVLKQGLEQLGYKVNITYDPRQAEGVCIALAGRALHYVKQPFPKNLIIYNLEQLHDEMTFNSSTNAYLEKLKMYPIWEYSRNNAAYLEKLGITPAAFCRLGYASQLTQIKHQEEKDIDVLFYGTPHPRRKAILNALKNKGVRVKYLHRIYGKERDSYIARSKIVLNMHMQPAGIFEIARVSYLLANKVCVVSETGQDQYLEAPFQEGVAFCHYDKLVDACITLLKDDQARVDYEQKGFELIQAMPQSQFLVRTIEQHKKQQTKSLPVTTNPTIFIALPSYLDSECVSTIQRIFEAADHPERIRVGVCWQSNDKIGPFPWGEVEKYKDRVHVVEVDVTDSKGANWARSEALKLHQGEDFALLMDAHMYMVDGWDSYLIQSHQTLGNAKTVFTYYCPHYTPPNRLAPEQHANRRLLANYLGRKGDPQLLHLNRSVINAFDPRYHVFYPTPFIVHHFIFGPRTMFEQVPMDPNIYFWGDELTLSMRLWTHGYHIYQLPKVPAYHQWNNRDETAPRDYRKIQNERAKVNAQYVKMVLGLPHQSTQKLDSAYALGEEKSPEDFWKFSGVDLVNRKIAEHGKQGMWDISVLHGGKPSIFVNIAAYRDQDCKQTVEDVLAKATYPDRVSVGICWQVDKKEDTWFELLDSRQGQVRQLVYDWQDGKGVCWARAEAYTLWQGEDYVLQIDSHSRFAQGWDEQLIGAYEDLDQEKAVISSPPATFKPDEALEAEPLASVLRLMPFRRDGNLRTTGALLENRPAEALQGLFISAGFMFAPAQMIHQVQYDPHMYFDQEEVSYALRLFTHGWDVYHPPIPPVYHHYAEHQLEHKHYHWQDLTDAGLHARLEQLLALGLERFGWLTGAIANLSKQAQKAPKRYGLGKERSLLEFEERAGIDFKQQHVAEKGLRARFIKDLEPYVPGEIFVPELDETSDSSAKHTENLADSKISASIKGNANAADDTMKHVNTDISLLVCLSADNQQALVTTLTSLFDNAVNKDTLRVAVAWHGAGKLELPKALSDKMGDAIHIQHVQAEQRIHNAFKDAMALWQQEDYIMLTQPGVAFAPDWDALLGKEFAGLDDHTLLTNIAGSHADSYYRIAAAAADDGLKEQLIKPVAVVGNKETSRATPLTSMDFIAGKAGDVLACVPDPYMDASSLALTHSARLWTHGIKLLQLETQLVYQSDTFGDSQEDSTTSTTRALHILGLAYTDQLSVLKELDRYGHGEVKDVESFWKAVGVNVDSRGVHSHALAGVWDKLLVGKVKLNSKQMQPLANVKAAAVSVDTSQLRIFVQIASYRDKQCQYTVQDLFTKAKYPDRVYVGVCWQTIPEEDQECFRIITRPEQVRVVHFDARESKGACWARHHGQKLWQGEEFTLQIDSHMRFEEGWDELLLSMYQEIGKEKAVLTTYPAGFTPPDTMKPRMAYRMVAKHFNEQGILTMTGKRMTKEQCKHPWPGAFVSACLLFGPSSMIRDVPYDPYLYFFGEEITLSVRLWTHGYDIYHPNKHVMWHDWKRDNRKTTHFKDHKWQQLNRQSFARVRYLLAKKEPERSKMQAYVRQEIDSYGLGQVRSLKAYEAYAGVSFAKREIADFSRRGVFSTELLEAVPTTVQDKVTNTLPAADTNRVEPFVNPKPPIVMPKKKLQQLPNEERVRNFGAIKTLETPEVIVYDDFLPEEEFERLYQFAVTTNYKHINTTGNVTRVWNIDNGFPLRSGWNHYYDSMNQKKHSKEHTYPTGKPSDIFVDRMNAMMPEVEHLIGTPGKNWAHFSVTSWLYPQNTGLSLHNDGSSVYTGAYVYFLNREWRIHWGGLLMVMDGTANHAIEEHKRQFNANQFHRGKWLHESEHNDYAMEAGFARTIFPKRNRIVFIAPDAYHMVTKILPAAGDNVRMSFAGFFNRGVLGNQKAMRQAKQHPLEVKQ